MENQPTGFFVDKIVRELIRNPDNIKNEFERFNQKTPFLKIPYRIITALFPESSLGLGEVVADEHPLSKVHSLITFRYDEKVGEKTYRKRKGTVRRNLSFIIDKEGKVEDFKYDYDHGYESGRGTHFNTAVRVEGEFDPKDGAVKRITEEKDEQVTYDGYTTDQDVKYTFTLTSNGVQITVNIRETLPDGSHPDSRDITLKEAQENPRYRKIIKKFPPTDFSFLFKDFA